MTLAFVAVVWLTAAIVVLGDWGLSTVVDTYESEVLRIRENRLRAETILASGAEQGRTVYAYAVTPDAALRSEFLEQQGRAAEALSLLRGSAGTDHARMLMDGIGAALAELERVGEATFAAAGRGATTLTPARAAQLRAAHDGLQRATGELIAFQDERALMHRDNAADVYFQARRRIVVSAALMGVLLVAVGFLFVRGIARPIRLVADASDRLADGDLTLVRLDVNSRDEIGDMADAFQRMASNLRAAMQQIRTTSGTLLKSGDKLSAIANESAGAMAQIAGAVQQMADGTHAQVDQVHVTRTAMQQLRQAIDQIARGAQQQAEQVEQTTRTLDDVIGAIEQVSHAAHGVAEAAAAATARARVGGEAVERVGGGMRAIRGAVQDAARSVHELGEYSSQIGHIVDVISEIAEQTNLLALNAAIEAARAGEHGRGFGVVADEVRQLAERSAASTGEISGLIDNIQVALGTAVTAIEAGTTHVATGSELVDNAGSVLNDIIDAIETTDQLGLVISEAVRQMDEASPGMLSAMNEMAAVTEENTAATEQMAASSDHVMGAMDEVATYAEASAAATEQVGASSEEVAASADDLRSTVRQLNDVSEALERLVAGFRLNAD